MQKDVPIMMVCDPIMKNLSSILIKGETSISTLPEPVFKLSRKVYTDNLELTLNEPDTFSTYSKGPFILLEDKQPFGDGVDGDLRRYLERIC